MSVTTVKDHKDYDDKIASVIENRHLYIGGSEMEKLFKSKSSLKELAYDKAFPGSGKKFLGNKYTDYGNLMEPLIRDYVNDLYKTVFYEDTIIDEELGIRGNFDGYSEQLDLLLEIKTAVPTKSFEDAVNQYKYQLLTYCYLLDKCPALLVVLVNQDFKPKIDNASIISYQEFTFNELLELCDLTEEEFIDKVYDFWDEVTELEKQGPQTMFIKDIEEKLLEMKDLKEEEAEIKEEIDALSTEIKVLLDLNKISKYKRPDIQVTFIEETSAKSFDSTRFKADHSDLYNQYSKVGKKAESIRFKLTKDKEDK